MKGYGFDRDLANDRLRIKHSGTEVFRITAASGVTMYGGALTVDSGGVTVTAGTISLPAATIAESELTAAAFTGANMKATADVNVLGGQLLLFRVKTAGAATASIDVTVTHAIRVLRVWTVVTAGAGTAGDTITVKNTATAITDAINVNDADTTISREGTLDYAAAEIAALGTLRVTETDGGGADSPAVDVYIMAVRIT